MPKNEKQKFSTSDSFCLIAAHILCKNKSKRSLLFSKHFLEKMLFSKYFLEKPILDTRAVSHWHCTILLLLNGARKINTKRSQPRAGGIFSFPDDVIGHASFK